MCGGQLVLVSSPTPGTLVGGHTTFTPHLRFYCTGRGGDQHSSMTCVDRAGETYHLLPHTQLTLPAVTLLCVPRYGETTATFAER